MPGSGRAEIYFIAAMMILIMILSVAAVIIFFKTYKKEMRERAERTETRAATSVRIADDEAKEGESNVS